jgi:hypothetical protein
MAISGKGKGKGIVVNPNGPVQLLAKSAGIVAIRSVFCRAIFSHYWRPNQKGFIQTGDSVYGVCIIYQ